MTKNLFLAIMICFGLLYAGTALGYGQALDVTTNDRPWLEEGEFQLDTTLHANLEQVIVFYLEPADTAGKPHKGKEKKEKKDGKHRKPKPFHPRRELKRNTARFVVPKPTEVSFCIPSAEPYLQELTIASASGNVRYRTKRGKKCRPVTLKPGRYELNLYHDSSSVPGSGKLAFLAPPAPIDVLGDSTSPAPPDFMVFKGPNGRYVTQSITEGPYGNIGNLTSSGTSVDAYSVWQFVYGPNSFELEDGAGNRVNVQTQGVNVQCLFNFYTGSLNPGGTFCPDTAAEFTLAGTPDRFSLAALGVDSEAPGAVPVVVNSQTYTDGLEYDAYADPAIMSADYRGFRCANDSCGGDALMLQKGEVALFSQCNFAGPAVVFTADVPDFSIYDTAAELGLGIGDNMAASLRVGPDTLAVLHGDAQFGGPSLRTAADISCLDSSALGGQQASSLQIIPGALDYVISSNGCSGCDLSGIDLTGLDLSGYDFSGADLSAATITGADFRYTNLRCANLSSTDLTSTDFGSVDVGTVVSDPGLIALLAVDPETGDRTVLSGDGAGAGPSFLNPLGLDSSLSDGLVVADLDKLVKVDSDGARTILSGNGIGSGPSLLLSAADVAIAADGALMVVSPLSTLVIRVDPASGDRVIVSGAGIGTGPEFVNPTGIAVSHDGALFVVDAGLPAIFIVDPSSGDRTLVSGPGIGTGPGLQVPAGGIVDDDGSLLVSDSGIPAVMRVDPVSGDRTLVSGPALGSGPSLSVPGGILVSGDGTLLVADEGLPGLFRVDPETGDRSIVSGSGLGSGPAFSAPVDIAIAFFTSIPLIATDFSCRLDLSGSTLDLTTFAVALWRYMDLTDAKIQNASGTTLSTLSDALDLSGAILNGATGLSGVILDGADLGCATPTAANKNCTQLLDVDLSKASLIKANLADAVLNGANLNLANLTEANLQGAQLLKSPVSLTSARLEGASLKNANLARADLSGANLTNANWYSTGTGTCPGISWAGTCASGEGAILNSTNFEGAYLNGLDLSDATPQGADFNGALLLGANFTRANLSRDPTTGVATTFANAFLQGADFTDAITTGADFDSAYVDLSSGGTRLFQLPVDNLEFTGYDPFSGSIPGCVEFSSSSGTSVPETNSGNTCPNAENGPCTDAKWQSPVTPITSAAPSSTADTVTGLPNGCNIYTLDFNWISQ